MTSRDPGDGPLSNGAERPQREDGPYVLRPLLANVPLSADGSEHHVEINCVEYLGELRLGLSHVPLV